MFVILGPKFCLRLNSLVSVTVLTLVGGCSSLSSLNIIKNRTSRLGATSRAGSVLSAETPSNCPKIDLLAKAINKAQNAATLAQSARSKQEWDLVALQWTQAVEALQSIPADSPRRVFAQKKVTEYLQNLGVAQQKSATTNFQIPFSSFDNPILNDQLLLYLSYLSAVGTPDVLIVGSSRALVGIDPRQLQLALATQGRRNLKIFNFAVNGATAQMVDFQLRQLLTAKQLPRLIIWADGARAFNSGRVDRTYNTLVSSSGYQHLMAGDRPTLPQGKPETTNACDVIPGLSMLSTTQQSKASVGSAKLTSTSDRWQLAQVAFESTTNPILSLADRLLLSELPNSPVPQQLTTARNTTGYSSFAIDANGFLPLDNRFDPDIYYQKNPRVVGRYDADYQPFSLDGQQAAALNSIKAFAGQQKIPLVFVNLPLTQDYLDSVRENREEQFQRFMQQQVSTGFVFIDLEQQWLTKNKYFTDPSHLNRFGAAAVSRQLAGNSKIPWPQMRS